MSLEEATKPLKAVGSTERDFVALYGSMDEYGDYPTIIKDVTLDEVEFSTAFKTIAEMRDINHNIKLIINPNAVSAIRQGRATFSD